MTKTNLISYDSDEDDVVGVEQVTPIVAKNIDFEELD